MTAAAVAEVVDAGSLERIEPAWRDLSIRAAPNVFAGPDFLLPAFAHLDPRGVDPIAVWDSPARTRLIAFVALRRAAAPATLARAWRHELAALPAFLIDEAAVEPALAALRAESRGPGLILPFVEVGTALDAALARLGATPLARISRAALRCAPGANFADGLPAKKRKEWRRQRRRLDEGGATVVSADDGTAHLDSFLALETAGWKGRRGTALDQDAAPFVRALAARFRTIGALRMFSLKRGGAALAAGLVLVAGRRAFYWKTAYDERYAEASPGVQLTLDLSSTLERDPQLDLVDSCAVPGHRMIESLWSDRLAFVEWALPRAAGGSFAFSTAIRLERLARAARAGAKAALGRGGGP